MSEKKVLVNKIAGAAEIEILPAVDDTISISDINKRLLELEQRFQLLLIEAAGNIGNESYIERFRKLSEETAALKEKRKNLEAHRSDSEGTYRIKKAIEFMENNTADIQWSESTIRQLVDWVKILSADEILVCLHGGIEIRQQME